jgi:hypothetical protein
VNLAARGARNMDNGKEFIQEDPVKAQIRRQARQVYIKSFVLAVVLTGVCLLVPVK